MNGTGPIRVLILSALIVAIGCIAACSNSSPQDQKTSGTIYFFKRMADGKKWTPYNLNVNNVPSYCYENAEQNCRRYGHLYTWESAQRACQLLGRGSRLPTDDEWRQLAKAYGGVHDDAVDGGKTAYTALLTGGASPFNAVLGGDRAADGQFARLEAHGFYWTASETDPGSAWFYNFGKGSVSLYRQRAGEKGMALSVRCVRD
jgi:uncharacterized protein (TIGR02145 family)